MATPEKTFENKIKRYLESVGVYPLGANYKTRVPLPVGYYEKRWGGGLFSRAGLPDLHICIHGHSIEVEIKQEKGRLSELQKFVIRQINDSGGLAMTVYPQDFDNFKETIERYL